jgi:hypothetical protein
MKRTKKAGALIAQGAFGCVNRPPLHCAYGEHDYTDKISKLLEDAEADKELAEYVNIDRVDPQNMFHLPKPTKCEPGPIDPAEAEKCKVFADATDKKALLLMSDGGSDLTKVNWNTIDKPAFLIEIIRLFKGVELFVKTGFVHYDIKLDNIVLKVSPEGMRLNYIDFGLMKTLEWVKTPDNNTLGVWAYYPLYYSVIKSGILPTVPINSVINFLSRVTTVSIERIFADMHEYNGAKLPDEIVYNFIATRFDSYQLGLALIQLLPKLTLPMPLYHALFGLFYRMMHPNLAKRMWIEDATREYETILNAYILRKPLTAVSVAVINDLEQIPDSRGNSPKYDKLEPIKLDLPPPPPSPDEQKLKRLRLDSPVRPEPPILRGGRKRTKKRAKKSRKQRYSRRVYK